MQREVRFRLGPTGSGKTHGAIEEFQQCPRAIVAEAGFDEFPAMRFAEFPDTVLYLERIGAFQNPNVPFRVSYSPRLDERDLLFSLAWELGNVWLYLDEADRFDISPAYDEIITRGRHKNISLNIMALRPYALPIDLRAQATRITCYRQTEKADVDWVRGRIGDMALQLPSLPGPPGNPPFPFLYWDSITGAKIVKP